MFDFSFGEIGLVAVVALLVLGPERLPKVARTAGALMRRARSSWQSVRDEIERELAAEDLKRSIAEVRQAAADLRNDVHSAASDVHGDVRAAMDPAAVMTQPAEFQPASQSPSELPIAEVSDGKLDERH